MKKTKSLSTLITDLQAENERLQSLNKLFNKACKTEFGYDVDTIHKIIEKQRIYDNRRAMRQQGITAPTGAVMQGQPVPEQ